MIDFLPLVSSMLISDRRYARVEERFIEVAFSLPCAAIFFYPQTYPQNNRGFFGVLANVSGNATFYNSLFLSAIFTLMDDIGH